MNLDVHAREAHAERRWARRGASLPARFLHWLARSHPWAWRVRLDLIILFNLASWLLFLLLAHVLAPTLLQPGFEPDSAAGVATTVSAVAAIGFAVHALGVGHHLPARAHRPLPTRGVIAEHPDRAPSGAQHPTFVQRDSYRSPH